MTLPDFVGSNTDVAITNKVLNVSLPATESTPLELIDVPGVTAPVPAAFELTLHVTALLGLFVPVIAALNWREPPADTV